MTPTIPADQPLQFVLHQFIFPFSLDRHSRDQVKHQMMKDGFHPFYLQNLSLEDAFYGEDFRVSHHNLERYYLPFTNRILFPRRDEDEGLRRFSKSMSLPCRMDTESGSIRFTIHSVDVILCPFDIGFITLRTELDRQDLHYTQALEFAGRFRVLQNLKDQQKRTLLTVDEGDAYQEVEDLIFHKLVPGMMPYMDKTELKESYFEKLPFFVDERMFVHSLYAFDQEQEITDIDLYRGSRIDGTDEEGCPYISASNSDYISRYCRKHAYDRWAPHTYYLTEETSFVCLTNQEHQAAAAIGSHMCGEYYYAILLNLFYKIVLLKLSTRYSHVQLEKNQDEIEELIRAITLFSAKYYFLEVVSQSQGKDIFLQVKDHLGSDHLFKEVKETLSDLYTYQEDFTSKRSSYLLQILTIYTVISGIYGMNQVIEDLKGDIDWSKVQEYSSFEYIALGVTLTGIVVSFGLGMHTIYRLYRGWRKRKELKKL
ncbi:hypothetical protein [Paenibacillus mucilaginosus]|uniref:Group-specific protein n=1 Tax=Paenibacillus mucilaginosus (strain KNP414) TaxID=1036673 RepID=F8FPN8_PAEMK|nr:hypothetical protein [Paenibacillus mucilaginosus]AEI45855.1 hypothetical protein KNP414_07348 [Paenibacillus mucilaginosus KNP414]MCG7217806.1 hypothetical protein [Paenibacillus mucilaginosus]WDM27222.1 hypothetical protein KCX80_33330 [Paenibacillus mucilaginosus]